MASKTPNLGLNIWGREDQLSVAEWTENFTRIDQAVPAAEESAKTYAKEYADSKMSDTDDQIQQLSDSIDINSTAISQIEMRVATAESNLTDLSLSTQENAGNIGDLATLATTNKEDLVAAVNEIYSGSSNEINSGLSLFVDAENGDDTANDGLSESTPWKTIARAMIFLKGKIINAAVRVYLKGVFAEAITIRSMYGYGELHFLGRLSGATEGTASVNEVKVEGNHCKLILRHLTVVAGWVIISNTPVAVSLGYIISINPGIYGVHATASLVEIGACTISNKTNRAIAAFGGGKVYSSNNSGSGNAVGLYAETNSEIGKYGSQPAATTAETTNTAGVIHS